MSKKYKVLWLEDESEKMDAFFDLAYNEDIELHLVTSFNMLKSTILGENKFYFDAIILDALGVIDHNIDEKASLRALQESINFINQHKSQEVIPFFILSGYLGNDEYNNVREMLGSNTIYIKTKDEKKLFQDIKISIQQRFETQLKHRYSKLLEVCSDSFLGSDQFPRLFSLIMHVETQERLFNAEDMLNPMRKIIERMFSKLADIGIIPQAIINNNGSTNGASLFLSGKHNNYKHLNEIFHPMIAENVFRLVSIIQDGSHSEGSLRLRADEYLKSSQTDYSIRSSIFLLFDILSWFKNYFDNNKDFNINVSRYESLYADNDSKVITSAIEQDGDRNYHCGEIILTYKTVRENNYQIGDEIRITKIVENTNERTMHLYPKSALQTEKV
ncbi:MAG: hypothetical protein IPL55_09885 [Saprospiraceae bacterium]|nr:hypothetical protein [Saprospiraceae bacterium]